MKKNLILPFAMLAAQALSAQIMVVGKDTVTLEKFKKDNEYGLKSIGIEKTLKNTQDFLLLQQFAAEKKADTITAYRTRLAQREVELREKYFFPQNLVDDVLRNYIADSQTERNIQIFMVQKTADDNNDYQKIYSEVKSGKMTMEDAISKFTKNLATPFYIKPGILDADIYGEIVKLSAGGYTPLINNSAYVIFAKYLGSRPSLGYMVFGTLAYPNNAAAEGLKNKIYADLKSGKSFPEVTKLYGTTENEKNNGGAVMGSPILPDEVYKALEGKGKGFISQPVLMGDKYYIFNIYELEPYQLTEKNKDFFKKEMMSSVYGREVADRMLTQLKNDPKFKIFTDFKNIKKSYQDFSNFKNEKAPLYQFGNQLKNFGDFRKELLEAVKEPAKIPAAQWPAVLDMKLNQDVMNFYSDDFDNQEKIKSDLDATRKNIYSEYLYSEYFRKEIDAHPEWLQNYYNEHKDKFLQHARAKGRVAILVDGSLEKDVEAQMADPKKWEVLKKKYYGKMNSKGEILVHFQEGEMDADADIFKKYNVPFQKGQTATKMKERTVLVAIDDLLPPSQMTLDEAKDLLKDAVTEQKIQETIARQRAKTKITVDPAFLNDLEKNFKK